MPDADLKVVAVRRGHRKWEALGSGVQQVEGHGGDHCAAHGGCRRTREQADAEEAGARNLRRCCRVGPKFRLARKEPKELGDNISREAVDVLRREERASSNSETMSGHRGA